MKVVKVGIAKRWKREICRCDEERNKLGRRGDGRKKGEERMGEWRSNEERQK